MKNSYDKILDATLELVNEKSYHGTSLTMIAEKINMTKGAIFHHFKSKESILLALFEEAVLAVIKQASLILNDSNLTGEEKLKRWIHSYLDNLKSIGDIIKAYLRESRFISNESKTTFKKRQRIYVNLIVSIIQQTQKEDEQAFRDFDPKILALSILGMLNSVVNWFDYKGKLSTEELSDMMYEMISTSFQK